jgi:hypothetical protein
MYSGALSCVYIPLIFTFITATQQLPSVHSNSCYWFVFRDYSYLLVLMCRNAPNNTMWFCLRHHRSFATGWPCADLIFRYFHPLCMSCIFTK